MASRKSRDNTDNTNGDSTQGELIVEPPDSIQIFGGDDYIQRLLSDIVRAHDSTLKAQSIAVLHAMTCGHRLRTLKTHVGHGNFGMVQEYLKEKYGISERTVQRYIQLANNEEFIVARLRELNPPQVADLTDEQVLESTTITRALRVLSDDEADEETNGNKTSSKSKSKPRFTAAKCARWQDCHVPVDFTSILPKVWDTVDVFVSFIDESLELPFGHSHPAEKQSNGTAGELTGRVLVNAIRKEAPSDLLRAVAERFREGAVSEAFVALSCASNAEAIAELRSFPRLILRQHPYAEVATESSKSKQPYPCAVMILLLTQPTRVPELASEFLGVGDLYVPFVSAT